MMQQTNTSLRLRTCAGERAGDSLNAAGRRSQVAGRRSQVAFSVSQALFFEFAKAAWPSHRHSRKPARFEFTRNVRLQADTVFGHVFCRTTVSKCDIQKREIQAFGGRGYAPA
ncbi:hypothetical protein [Limnobacter thiooxidans]|uniref:hypothetical protein n=1 Tax=Limnobacter thiooxidans TaxID=131080 RepID=UPI0030C68AB7